VTVTALQVADVRFFLSGELIKSSFVMSASSQLIQIDLAPKVRSPKPSWLKAKAPVGDNFHNLKKLARAGTAYGLRVGAVSEHWRMLGPSHRDFHAAGRYLHAAVRVLRGA
jgi:hypothetical protein